MDYIKATLSNNFTVTLLADGTVTFFDEDDHFATEGRWEDGRIEDAPAPLGEEVYEEAETLLAEKLDELDADDIITHFFDEWDGGFVGFVYEHGTDLRQETRTQLADGEIEQLADDVAYVVHSGRVVGTAVRSVTEAEARTWLADNTARLIEEIDESLAND